MFGRKEKRKTSALSALQFRIHESGFDPQENFGNFDFKVSLGLALDGGPEANRKNTDEIGRNPKITGRLA